MRTNQIIKKTLSTIALGIFMLSITMLALLPLDIRMRNKAIKQADQIASTTWTKISAKPIGKNGYIVHLRADDPAVPDQELLVISDDVRGQQLLAMQDGCRIKASRGESQRFRSRALAYNYLDYSCSTVAGPPPARS